MVRIQRRILLVRECNVHNRYTHIVTQVTEGSDWPINILIITQVLGIERFIPASIYKQSFGLGSKVHNIDHVSKEEISTALKT